MQFSRHVELSETVAAFFFHAQLAYKETTVRSLIRLRSISLDGTVAAVGRFVFA